MSANSFCIISAGHRAILTICAANLIALGALHAAGEITFTTNDGENIENVRVLRAEPDGLVLRGESGILKIPFKKLPESLQKEYGFDPQKASETASPAAGTTSDTSGTFSETRSPFLPSLTEIEPFFQQFIDRGHPTPRDQFETQEEYSARLPKDLDSTIIY